jgi:hypothetical protein
MRFRHRKTPGRRRLDAMLLDLRTASWLSRRLWKPTLAQLVPRQRR